MVVITVGAEWVTKGDRERMSSDILPWLLVAESIVGAAAMRWRLVLRWYKCITALSPVRPWLVTPSLEQVD